jgi:hypothetical protein
VTKFRYATIGSVSSGTMRPEDLIPDFAWELKSLMRGNRLTRDQRKRFNALLKECDKDIEDCEDADGLLDELFDALGEFAPPYCYFGASEGDGAATESSLIRGNIGMFVLPCLCVTGRNRPASRGAVAPLSGA